MSREGIGYDAVEYVSSKQLPFIVDIERFTLFSLAGDVTGIKVLDAGCGDGIYSRELIDRGAAHVIGVDGDERFISLAGEKSRGYNGKLEFHHNLIQHFHGIGDRELILGSYIMSYPRSLDDAVRYCRAIASHLSEGGRFVGFNNNPFDVFDGRRFAKYGCEKEMHGESEGAEVIWRVEGMSTPIINYYLKPETYEKAFAEAGFSDFEWVKVMLDPKSDQEEGYWDEFFENEPPFIAMSAVRK